MKKIRYTGWYSDLIPSQVGEFASTIKDQSLINGLPFLNEHPPTLNILFLRYYFNGLYYIAGQGSSGECFVKNTSHPSWVDLGPTFGISPVYFYRNQLYVVRSSNSVDIYNLDSWDAPVQTLHQQIGTQGIRFIDASGIHTGDETYDGSHTEFRLAEWTFCGGVHIGQSYIDGAVVVFDAIVNGKVVQQRKVLEPGDCRWIRAYSLDSENYAIAIVKQPENQAVFIWLSKFEMMQLEDEQTVIDPPIPPDPNMPPFPPDLSAQLTDVKARLIHDGESLVGENAGKIVRQFAFEHRNESFALLEKTGGNNFEGCSVDYLTYGTPDNYSLGDVIGNAGTTNSIQWGFREPTDEEKDRFIRVLNDPGYFSDSPIPPNPPSDDIQKQINELKAENARQQAEIDNLKQQSSETLHNGDSVSIQSMSGPEHNQFMRYDWSDKLAKFDRNEAGSGETYKLERK